MTDKIKKFFDSLDAKTKERIAEKIESAKKNPFVGKNIKKMTGYGKNIFRLRVGDIRVIYSIGTEGSMTILDIDFRGNIY